MAGEQATLAEPTRVAHESDPLDHKGRAFVKGGARKMLEAAKDELHASLDLTAAACRKPGRRALRLPTLP